MLSNPSIVVVDNQVATLMVGSDVPITTGQACSGRRRITTVHIQLSTHPASGVILLRQR